MKNKSMLLRSIVCSLTFLIFWSLMFFTAYIDNAILHPFIMAIVFGTICGTVIAIVTDCTEVKKTVLARIIGVISVIVLSLIVDISSIPHRIILYKYRNDAFVRETGRITINESLVFGWSNMFFCNAMVVSFAVTAMIILIYKVMKNRRIKNQADL